MNELAQMKQLAREARDIGTQIEALVVQARRRGTSWQRIADTLCIPAPAGQNPVARYFPGGVSVTAVRSFYEYAVKQAERE